MARRSSDRRGIRLTGTVVSGQGVAGAFTRLDWVEQAVLRRCGWTPFPGTLNLRLDRRSQEAAARLRRLPALRIEPPPGFCAAHAYPCGIAPGVEGLVLFPEVPDYPADKLEILAPIGLRGRLGLADGDPIAIVARAWDRGGKGST